MSDCNDHATLRKAALQLIELDEAGWGHRFDQAVNDELWTDENRQQLNALNFHLTLRGVCGSEVNQLADRLVKALECDREQALAVAIELCGYRTRRVIALEILPKMVNELRRAQAQERRNLRITGRAAS